MNAVLRVTADEEVYVVGHRFQFDDRCLPLRADFPDDLLETGVDAPVDDLPSALGAPDDMVSASVDHVDVRSDLARTHDCQRSSI